MDVNGVLSLPSGVSLWTKKKQDPVTDSQDGSKKGIRPNKKITSDWDQDGNQLTQPHQAVKLLCVSIKNN